MRTLNVKRSVLFSADGRIVFRWTLAALAILLCNSVLRAEVVGPYIGVDAMTTRCEIVAIVHLDAEAVGKDGVWEKKGFTWPWTGKIRTSSYSAFICSPLRTIKGFLPDEVPAPMMLCRIRQGEFDTFYGGNNRKFRQTPFDLALQNWVKMQTSSDYDTIPTGVYALVFLSTDAPYWPPQSLNVPGSTIVLPASLAKAKIPEGTPNFQIHWLLQELIGSSAPVKSIAQSRQ